MRKVYVWDRFVRFFHWSLVVLVAFQWLSAELEGRWLDFHMIGGYCVLALVALRILWGFVGSPHARFGSFVRGVGPTLEFARALCSNTPPAVVGHNPLGGWMVLALLGVLLALGTTGLFANDDVLTHGPLAHLISGDFSRAVSETHKAGFNLLLGLVALHVAAILAHRIFRGENLARAMITGYKGE